jgi:hypothetical protein
VIRAIAALALATASTQTAAALVSTASWWEKVTVTIAGDGKTQGCRFESSLKPDADQDCEVASPAAAGAGSSGAKDQYTRITFERRFSPGAQPDVGDVGVGDTLLGRQVMALAIDGNGAVSGCKIVATSGDMTPEYCCKEAAAEKFEASAKSAAPAREGYMTIIVYGHAEHVV